MYKINSYSYIVLIYKKYIYILYISIIILMSWLYIIKISYTMGELAIHYNNFIYKF